MRAKGPRYKKASVVGVKIVSTMSAERKRKPSVHPAGEQEEEDYSNDDARGL